MRWREPSHRHVEFAVLQSERALQDSIRDRSRDFAAVAGGALNHHYDDVPRVVIWRETRKPGNVFLLPAISSLGGTSLPRHHPIFQTRSAARAAVFVNDLPKAFAD